MPPVQASRTGTVKGSCVTRPPVGPSYQENEGTVGEVPGVPEGTEVSGHGSNR